jgi:biopolymer transport protein ExbB/TolQ
MMIVSKMDNNMTAIVSLIMLGLGFVNGMIVTTLLDKLEVAKASARVQKVLDDKFDLEQEVDELREELELERRVKNHILEKLNSIVRQHQELPPPQGPIQRSCLNPESDSDSEEDDFNCPVSPEPNPGHMG